MKISFLPKFKKQYKKLPLAFQVQFDERLRIFVVDRTDPRLRVHPLRGAYAGYWSMNINGDIRTLYLDRGDQLIIFALIGTRSELYG